MTRWLQIVLASCAVAVTLAICFLVWRTTVNEQAIGDAATALKAQIQAVPNLQPTLDAISGPRGTLHEVNKAVVKIGDMAVTSQRQVAQSSKLVDAAAQSITSATSDVHTLATEGTRTLAAATDLTQALAVSLPATVNTANSLLSHSDATVTDFDALLKSHAIDQTLTSVASMTESGAGILANGKTVSDKITYDFMHPVPAWKQPMKILQLGFDAALLAK